MFSRYLGMLLTISMFCSTIACSSGNPNQVSPKAQKYSEDGYMGITSVNPNVPLNPTYHDYNKDTDLMKAVIHQINGITKSSITIHGPIAYVKLHVKDNLTRAEAMQIKSQVQMALSTNMPRYRIKVSVKRR